MISNFRRHSAAAHLVVRFVRVVGAGALLAACGGGGDDGGTTGPGTGGNNGGGNPPASTTVTLTITSRSVDAGYAAGPIFTYVGDVTETRARMPQLMSENSATVRPAGESVKTTTLTVTKGKFVTLFATELGRAGFNTRPVGTQLSKVVPTTATEFVGWSGATLGQPEAGVATIKMDADATVIAEYRKMEGMTYTFSGCPDMNLNASGPGHLGFGTLDANTIPATGNNSGNSPTDYDQFYMYAKQGTVFTFKALKYDSRAGATVETGFLNWSGAAASCSSNLSCNVTIPPFGSAAAIVKSNNSYLANANTASACGACNATLGCPLTIRP